MSSTNKGPLPHIVLLSCGGTIAALPSHGVDYKAGLLPPDRLLDAVPDIGSSVHVTVERHADVGSQDVDLEIWNSLAARVRRLNADSSVDGIVVTHGTDTLEETAFFLHLVTQLDKPVVLTGAMRPAHALSADGPANLQAAICLAKSPSAKAIGVAVVMNDVVYDAVELQKISANALEAFSSRNHGPLARMLGGNIAFNYTPSIADRWKGSFADLTLDAWPKVPILYIHAGMDTDWVDALLATDPDGIVVAGVGSGNAPSAVWRRLEAAAARGLLVVRSSRCATGFVDGGVEVDDEAYGFFAAGGLSPQKARILLMCALRRDNSPESLRTLF